MSGIFLFLFAFHGAPLDVSLAATVVPPAYGVHPAEVGAYLITEHPGARYSGRCSAAGACGPFQLMPMWPRRFGYEQVDRDNAWHSAAMISQLMQASKRSHQRRCAGKKHKFITHLYVSRGQRESETAMRLQRGWKRQMKNLLRFGVFP